MTEFRRYAIFVVPTGRLYAQGAAWLGWDSAAARPVAQPDVPGLPVPADDLTDRPRPYGLHGTIKPPFRLAPGHDRAALETALSAFCAARAPLRLPALALRRLGRFLALVPRDDDAALRDLAAATVRDLDGFRAPLNEDELARRRRARLSAQQEALLDRWGYPFVMEEFRFHITLTGPLSESTAAAVSDALARHFADALTAPLDIEDLALLGEDTQGRFHLLSRHPLSGGA